MLRDIEGQFKLQAAMVGADGKHGPVTISTPVDFEFNCTSEASQSRR